MDDAAAGERQDALVEMSFYVPKEAEGFAGEGEDTSVKARACARPLCSGPACSAVQDMLDRAGHAHACCR